MRARRARRRRAARAAQPRARRARLLGGPALAGGVDLDLADVDFEQELVHVRGKGGKERVVPLGEEASHSVARLPPRVAARSSRAEPRTRSSSRPAAAASTRARCAACFRIRTACGTPSPRTCSRAAPTCARSRSCSATARSRRRRCTATWTRAACARSTTARIRAREPLRGSPARDGCPPLPPSDTLCAKSSRACDGFVAKLRQPGQASERPGRKRNVRWPRRGPIRLLPIPRSRASSRCSPRVGRRRPSRRTGATCARSATGSAARRRRRRTTTSSAGWRSCARQGSPPPRSRGASPPCARSSGTSSCSARAPTARPRRSSFRAGGASSRARSRRPRPSG